MSYDYGKAHRNSILQSNSKDTTTTRKERLGLKSEPVRRLRKNKLVLFVLSVCIGWIVSLTIFYSMGYLDMVKPLIGKH